MSEWIIAGTPGLPAHIVEGLRRVPSQILSSGNGLGIGASIDGRFFFSQLPWGTVGVGDGSSNANFAMDGTFPGFPMANPAMWTIEEMLVDDSSTSRKGIAYDGNGRYLYHYQSQGPWQDVITAVVFIALAYFGGTYIAEAYGTVDVGLTGMDLAADAGMGSVNSGGATWGGLGTGADTVATGDYFDFSDLYDNIDLPGTDAGSFDVQSFDWDYGNYQWDTYDSSSLFPNANTTPPVAPDYPIPEIQITPATASSGISYTLPSLSTVKEVIGLALTTASMVRAFQQNGGRVQDPTAVNRAADCATGMILTRNSTGQVSAMRPGVGVATVTTDGGMIINNGDGSYACISPTGQMVTKRYSTTGNPIGVTTTGTGMFSGIDPKILMIGGAALVGVLLLSQRKG